MSSAVTVALISLILIIAVHIVVIARWSGRIDGYIIASEARFISNETEITRLRDARHESDGIIQRNEGAIKDLQRLMDRREQR